MSSTIYNEGRVVGYSAYEVYVRHAVSEGMEPVSEKEWLSSTLTDGSSLLLQLTPNQLDRTGHTLGSAGGHIVDIPLPETNTYALTTTEPDDWKTRWNRYYTLNGNVYVLVSSFPVPIWESGKYYVGTAPTWVEDKYYELNDDQYELLTSRPVTWGDRWMYYYESDDGGQTFKPVVGIYNLEENQPVDWSTTWNTYFERTGTSPDYTYVLATNWRPNMYYRKVETHVTAANTIVASFFMGEGYYENTDDFWATHVKSYGRLLKNDVALDSETYIDAKDINCLGPGEWQNELRNYVNIVDGDVIVSGTWTPEQDTNTQPPNDFVPDLSDTASPTIIRLYIKEALTETINILLTGFMLKSILKGMTNLTDGSIDTNYPEDGDFLGPSTFPWGNKIIFSFPTAAISALLTGYSRTRDNFVLQTSEPTDFISAYYKYYEIQPDGYILTINEPQYWSNRYKRYYTKSGNTYTPITSSTAPTWVQNTYYAKVRNGLVSLDGITDTSSLQWEQGKYYTRTGDNYPITVSRAPTIDIDTTLGQYYQSNYSESPVGFTVNGTNLYDNNVLTVYSRFDILPPSLYGTLVQDTGEHKMYPIDTVAPGTVKIFEDDDAEDRANVVNHLSGNIGMYRDGNHIIHQNPNAEVGKSTVPIAEATVNDIDIPGETSRIAYSLDIETGDKLGKVVSLSSGTGPGSDLDLDGTSAVINPSASIDYPAEQNVPNSYCGTLHWNDLLHALAANKSIDLFSNSYFLKRFAEVLSDKLVAGKGIAVSTNLPGQPSGTSVISSDIIAGAGISINTSNNSLKITNTTVDKSVLPEMVSGDYHIYAGYDDGCCGMFHFPAAPEDAPSTFDTLSYDHLRIRYSPSGNGNSAQIYINTRATLTYTNTSIVEKTAPAQLQCESFKRFTNPGEQFERLNAIYSSVPNFYPHMFFSSDDRTTYITTQPSDWSTNWGNYYAYKNQFRLRHSYSNDAPWDEEPSPTVSSPDNSVPYQLTRILRIVFNLDNIVNGKTLAERLGMANTTITGATDTSQEITGVWNVRSTYPEDSGPTGASWEAVCRTEFAPDTTGTNHPGIFIYGMSYSDGYNDQIGDSVLKAVYDSTQSLPAVYLTKKYPNGVFIDQASNEYKLYGQYLNIGVSALLKGSDS